MFIMKFGKKIEFFHKDKECELRTIFDFDVTDNYILGLQNENKYLDNIPINVNKDSQMKYINSIIESEKDTICGLFVDSELIGTAGIQGIDADSTSTIGIFIFDQSVRGQGFGKTIVWASCFLANLCNGVTCFGAGMKKTNIPSLRSFLSCGFQIVEETSDIYKVTLKIKNLLQPSFISKINIEDIH